MNYLYRISALAILVLIFCASLQACESAHDGPAERAGEKVDETVRDAKDAADRAVDKVGEKVKEVGEDIEDRD